MATKATRLATRAIGAFEQAYGDLLEAARLENEAADNHRNLAREHALAAEAGRTRAGQNTRRAEALAALLELDA